MNRKPFQFGVNAIFVLTLLAAVGTIVWNRDPYANENARIEAVLDEPTSCNFTEVPLMDVAKYFKARHKIEIQFDNEAIDDNWTPAVSMQSNGEPLKQVLTAILDEKGMAYSVEHGVLLFARNNEY